MINKALSLSPLQWNLRNIKAVIYMYEQDYEKALDEINVCLELKENHPWSLYRYYEVFIKTRDHSAAYRAFKKWNTVVQKFTTLEIKSTYKIYSPGLDNFI